MFAITVTLLHGTIRAGSPDDTTLAGESTLGEWPPSPARLFSALVAADGTRARCTVSNGEELIWLEQQPPPVIYASAAEDVFSSPLRERYVVIDETKGRNVQEYPARTAGSVRRGVRQSPQDRRITYVWPDAEPAPEHRRALAARAARIGYFGCADSPARLTIDDTLPDDAGPAWRVDSTAAFSLPVPYSGFVQALDAAYDQWTSGVQVRRSWIRTERARYRAPGHSQVEHRREPVVIWLRLLDRTVSGRKLVAVTDTLRKAVIEHVQRLLGDGTVPAVLHGHRPDGECGPQARFLALPDVGGRHSDGRLFGAAVWLPPGTDAGLVELVSDAVTHLAGQRLVKPGWFDVGLSVHGGESRPWAANPRRWNVPARCWMSATPVVYERWSKRVPDLAEVARWCRHADLPDPIRAGVQRFPRLPGALDLHPSQVSRADRERRPYSHVVIEFAEPVGGPVVIGRARQLGLGLMAPDPAEVRGW